LEINPAHLATELAEANILATMGFASMPPLLSIKAAMEAADQMLIARKQKRVKQ
jgi:hypothetical protein